MAALHAQADRARAIAMWDFSWLERRWPGGGYADWSASLEGLVERGYDVVRIDAYPHLVSAGAGAHELLPVWTEHPWGSPERVTVEPLPHLLEFLALARDKGLLVSLSTWFRKDILDVRNRIVDPEALAAVWIDTLRHVEAAGLLDQVWFVDLCNEWPQPMWAPFLYGNLGPDLPRTSDEGRRWTNTALQLVADEFPQLPLCFSVVDQLDTWSTEDVSRYDLLEAHCWMSGAPAPSFYDELGYDLAAASFDPVQYDILRGAESLYRQDEARWRRDLAVQIRRLADWSVATGLPLVTTESWAVVCWKDHPGLSWEWVKDLCRYGVESALATGRWAALSTSNFCGPQFRGMWDDVGWHRSLTELIHGYRVEL